MPVGKWIGCKCWRRALSDKIRMVTERYVRAARNKRSAAERRPAFPGQTLACAIKPSVAFDVIVLARGSRNPGPSSLCQGAAFS